MATTMVRLVQPPWGDWHEVYTEVDCSVWLDWLVSIGPGRVQVADSQAEKHQASDACK